MTYSVQYDIERKAFWMIQDGGGDVVAMCDLQGSGGTARVVRSWQYDAYGQCLRATDIVASTTTYSIPMNRIGHKGLFMDRLDVSIADSSYGDNPRLAPFSTVLYQNRNRTYSPQLGRFIQRDPNQTGQIVSDDMTNHGFAMIPPDAFIQIGSSYFDGGSLHQYLRSNTYYNYDPTGLSLTAELGASSGARGLLMGVMGFGITAGTALSTFGAAVGPWVIYVSVSGSIVVGIAWELAECGLPSGRTPAKYGPFSEYTHADDVFLQSAGKNDSPGSGLPAGNGGYPPGIRGPNDPNKPRFDDNDGRHNPKSPEYVKGKTPLPSDAKDAFSKAISETRDGEKQWYALGKDGSVYRYSSANNGTAHFSGQTGTGDNLRVPQEIWRALGGKGRPPR